MDTLTTISNYAATFIVVAAICAFRVWWKAIQ